MVVVAGLAVGVLTVVGVIYIAAIMGGLALHRHGWIVGALFATWFLGGWWPAYQVGGGAGHVVYWGAFAVIGGGFWWMGRRAKAPMWVQGPAPGSPRLYVGEGHADVAGPALPGQDEGGRMRR